MESWKNGETVRKFPKLLGLLLNILVLVTWDEIMYFTGIPAINGRFLFLPVISLLTLYIPRRVLCIKASLELAEFLHSFSSDILLLS
jgi:hypothetical protein